MTVHNLVCGVSGCGKSRLMKEVIIPAHLRAGRSVIVLDPILSPGWPTPYVTDDPHRFTAVLKQSKNCVGVVDEYGHFQTDWKASTVLQWNFTIGRNFGHLMYVLAQRIMMVPPNVRGQCGRGFIFRQTAADLAVLIDTMGIAAMDRAAVRDMEAAPVGLCLQFQPFMPVRHLVVCNPDGSPVRLRGRKSSPQPATPRPPPGAGAGSVPATTPATAPTHRRILP